MKRLTGLAAVVLLAFYIAWPAFAVYQIKTSLEDKDATGLASRVDFDSVRQSLRPAVAAKVESKLDAAAEKAGPTGANIYNALKSQIMPKIIDAAMIRFLTPEALIKIYSERASLKDVMDRIVAEQVARQGGGDETEGGGGTFGKILGGLLGKTAPPEPAPTGDTTSQAVSGKSSPKYTLANIKGAGLDGPLAIYLKLAKDPAASKPDVTVRMSFTGTGWILTGLEPTS